MKKVFKMFGAAALTAVLAGSVGLQALACWPAAPNNYQKKAETGGELEAKYMASGPYEVSVHEDGTVLNVGKFQVYYPSELETASRAYPVIVLCNGTGVPLSKYPAVAKHLASWGFIVVGTEEEHSWNAFGAEMCLRYLERWNENEAIGDAPSLFYQKVDFDRVGIAGHSQGGVGVINAVTDTAHKAAYRAAVALSPTNKELAHDLFWDYDATRIEVPTLLMSGAGGGDDWVVTGEQLGAIYSDIGGDKVMMRRKDTPHGEMLYKANGYLTAWFMWLLQGDEEAARAFTGPAPEIMANELYQDQQSSLTE